MSISLSFYLICVHVAACTCIGSGRFFIPVLLRDPVVTVEYTHTHIPIYIYTYVHVWQRPINLHANQHEKPNKDEIDMPENVSGFAV